MDADKPKLRPFTLFGVAFLVVTLALGVWLSLTPAPPAPRGASIAQSGDSSQSETWPDPTRAVNGDTTRRSACGLATAATPVDAVKKATLTPVAGVYVPTLAGVGPGDTSSGFPSCFQQSPAGAVLAASSFVQFYSAHSSVDKVAEHMGARDDVRTAIMKKYANGANEPPHYPLDFLGYDLVEYTGTTAAVRLAVRIPAVSHTFYEWPVNLIWVDGDWKILLSHDYGFRRLDSVILEGYTEWYLQ